MMLRREFLLCTTAFGAMAAGLPQSKAAPRRLAAGDLWIVEPEAMRSKLPLINAHASRGELKVHTFCGDYLALLDRVDKHLRRAHTRVLADVDDGAVRLLQTSFKGQPGILITEPADDLNQASRMRSYPLGAPRLVITTAKPLTAPESPWRP